MPDASTKLARIFEVFDLTPRDLDKVLNVSPGTSAAWVNPRGLHAAVIDGLYEAALFWAKRPIVEAREVGSRLRLGIGALIFYGMTGRRQTWPTEEASL